MGEHRDSRDSLALWFARHPKNWFNALIRRFLITRNAERVLFIVDRTELAKQTLEDFNVILGEFKPVLYKTARRRPGELLGSCVVVATLQSLMVAPRQKGQATNLSTARCGRRSHSRARAGRRKTGTTTARSAEYH